MRGWEYAPQESSANNVLDPTTVGGNGMGLVLLILLLAVLFGGLGFAVHTLWLIAVVLAIVWLAGFAFRSGSGARWYRW